MSVLQIEFMDGKKLKLEIDQCSDQIGLFCSRGDVSQARRLGYVAARNGAAIALNGEAGKGIECYPLSSIRKLKEVEE